MALRIFVLLLSLHLMHAKLVPSLPLSCDDVRQFVDGHNARRLQLLRGEVPGQPKASSMKQMVWDEELVTKACGWASKNKYVHNSDQTIPSGRFRTGESLHLFSTTHKNLVMCPNASMEAWWAEHKDFKFHPLRQEDFSGALVVGHYTQMAWADTIYLGCAASRYTSGKWEKILVVCNYGPAGNRLGKKPYPTGGSKSSTKLSCGTANCNKKYGDHC